MPYDFSENILEQLRAANAFGMPRLKRPEIETTGLEHPDFTEFPRPKREILFEPPEYEEPSRAKETSERFYPDIDLDYNPRREAFDRFVNILNEQPVYKEPSGKRKILAAILSGVGADPQIGEEILYGEYGRKLANWKNRLDSLAKAAELESAANVNERNLLMQDMRNQIALYSANIREQLGLMKAALDQQKSDQIYEVKIRDLEEEIRYNTLKAQAAEAKLLADINNREAINERQSARLALDQANQAFNILKAERDFDERVRQFNLEMERKLKELELKGMPVTTTENVSGDRLSRTRTVTRGPGPVGTTVSPPNIRTIRLTDGRREIEVPEELFKKNPNDYVGWKVVQ